MSGPLDIQGAIEKSTSKVSLQDLSRKGVKQVKVLNQAVITRLITEAVDAAIEHRAEELSGTERKRVIAASRQKFQALAREQVQKEKQRNDELLDKNRTLSQELSASMEAARAVGEAGSSLAELESENKNLRQALAEKETEFGALADELSAKTGELDEQHRVLAVLEGAVVAKNEEIERLASSGGVANVQMLQDSLEKLRRSLSGLRSGAGASALEDVDPETLLKFVDHGDDISMESNVAQVEIHKRKSAGVGSSLDKLKKLQKGV